MRPVRYAGFAAGALLWVSALAGQTPAAAEALLSQAQAQAAEGQRVIFAIFHASW
jgi:hypothetical protein